MASAASLAALRLLRHAAPPAAQSRSLATGARGSRGHGWLTKYRAGLGGRHLQGRYHARDADKLNALNDNILALDSGSSEVAKEAYLDISVDGEESRRVVIELASAALPITCGNFAGLCSSGRMLTEEEDETDGQAEFGYELTKVHKIEKNVGLCLGDVLGLDGEGGRCHPSSSKGGRQTFDDENHVLSHSSPGIVSMLSPGVDRNDSRFIITTADAPQLDGRFVAFGRVKDGLGAVMDIAENVYTKRGRPSVNVQVVGCGVL